MKFELHETNWYNIMEKRTGGWIQTYSGNQFFPFDPRKEEIEISDIAHHLSQICRFGGASERFYSVAQHSVLVSSLCPGFELQGLLHDATEAYMGDVVTPLKRMDCFAVYRVAERALEDMIFERFGVVISKESIAVVKRADRMALAIERRDLLKPSSVPWISGTGYFDSTRDISTDEELQESIKDIHWNLPWSCEVAETEFKSIYLQFAVEPTANANQ